MIWTSPLGHSYQRLAEQALSPIDEPSTVDEDTEPDDDEDEFYTSFDTCIDVVPARERKPSPRPRPAPPPDDNEIPPF